MAMSEGHRAISGCLLGIECFRRFVGDLDRSIEFYCDALGFELDMVGFHADAGPTIDGSTRSRARRQAVLVLGRESIELLALESDTDGRASVPGNTPACSLAFQHLAVVAADMAAACARLSRFAPTMISAQGPVRLPPSTGSATALKFRDPDGHPLELIAFPAGTGDERWQRQERDAVTLGIDHSAIVVAAADRSIAFYRDILGCSVSGRQTNHGAGQDDLDGLRAVEVDVVAMRPAASATPHLELLGYRQPFPSAGGSSRQLATSTGDCIVWTAHDITDIAARLALAGMQFVVGPAGADDPDELLLLDPDGHAHLLLSDS